MTTFLATIFPAFIFSTVLLSFKGVAILRDENLLFYCIFKHKITTQYIGPEPEYEIIWLVFSYKGSVPYVLLVVNVCYVYLIISLRVKIWSLSTMTVRRLSLNFSSLWGVLWDNSVLILSFPYLFYGSMKK